MRYKFRHRVTFAIFRKVFEWYARFKYRYTFDRFEETLEPYLILGNHTQALDPVFMAFSFKKPIYFVASTMIYNLRVWSKVLDYLVAPIPINKFRSDLRSTKAILKTLKEGHHVALYPEGNTSFSGEQMPISIAIAKLVKKAKVKVLFHTIEGGHLSHPRWAKNGRKGKMHGSVKKILTVEEIAAMDVESLHQFIKNTLAVNDFKLFTDTPFKGKNKAVNIESAYVVCPHCHRIETLYSKGDDVHCTACEFHVTVNDYGRFEPRFEGRYFNATPAWFDDQIAVFKSLVETQKDDAILFHNADETLYEILDLKPKEKRDRVSITLTKKTLTIEGPHTHETWDPMDIDPAVQHRNGLILYHRPTAKTYYLLSDEKRSALKYVSMIKILQKETSYV